MKRYINSLVIFFFCVCEMPMEVTNAPPGDTETNVKWIASERINGYRSHFDARVTWICVKVQDGMRFAYDNKTSWAVIASSVLADRLCIKDNEFHEIFAAKELVSCVKDYGGDLVKYPKNFLSRAWEYYRDFGALTLGHYAYYSTCPAEDPIKSGPQFRYKISKFENFLEIQDLQKEIVENGPISALLEVEDLQRDIIWPRNVKLTSSEKEKMIHEDIEKMVKDGKENRRHIVKILGWKTREDGTVYWLCSKPFKDNANVFEEFYVKNKGKLWIDGSAIVFHVKITPELKPEIIT